MNPGTMHDIMEGQTIAPKQVNMTKCVLNQLHGIKYVS